VVTTARAGEAGRKGDDVRSDLHAVVEIADRGGIEVEVTSKVGGLYGASIEETARSTLSGLHIEHARVRIDDRGAVPYVIAARVEAAARRAGADGDARPERVAERRPHTERHRPRRSRLYLPGDQPKLQLNAGLHRPDGVILDLEDSVHPDRKDEARLVVRNALRCLDFGSAELMVRINQLPLGLADLESVAPERPDLVLLPKTETASQVAELDATIREILGQTQGEPEVWIMPILETARGIENAFEIASASTSVVALTIGLEDYTADLGVPKTLEGAESLYARGRLVNAARAAGVQPIDSVFGDVGDEDGLREWARRSRGLGFEGMGCVHPRQIRPIHEAFEPSTAEIEKALQIVAAFEHAEAMGLGVVSLGTRMVDAPVVLRAQRVVEAARRAGLIGGEPGS
jgi:citrate lyase subunit beta / citryl-CoA lyase